MKNILLLVLIMSIPLALAQEFPKPSDLYVNDFAHIFSSEQNDYLRVLLSGVRESTTAEVVVVSVESSVPYAPSEYRTKLFNEWGVGNKEKDNGMLILYSVAEKRIEVEVGYGLEGIFPDSKVGRMLDENYVPLREQGNFTEGILKFSEEVVKEIEANKEEVIAGNTGAKNEDFIIIVVVILAFLFLGIIMYYLSDRKKSFGGFWSFFFADFIARLLITLLLGGRNRNSGGGFGGGFGGGGSGGGGAGR